MNKEYYKRTFSKVRPSEKALERIFDMTEKKPKRIRFKGLIAVAVVIAILLCGTLTANAATDGKLYTGVKALASADEVKFVEKVNDHDSFLSRIRITINGEEVSLDDYIVTKSQSGDRTTVLIDSRDGDHSFYVEYMTPSDDYTVNSVIEGHGDLTVRADFETETESEIAVD